jgi:uncharacterized membrane protein HdeD (DUF308 family)
MSNAANGTQPLSLGIAIEHLRGRWGEIVAFGALLFVLGVAALCFTLPATIATVTINGIVFLVAGAAEIAVGAHAKSWARFSLWLIGGALYLIVGIICIVNRDLAAQALTLALGAGLIAAGVVRAYLAFHLPAGAARAMVLLAAAVTFLLGLVIVIHWPSDAVYVLGILLGVDLLFHGVGWASFGVSLRARR